MQMKIRLTQSPYLCGGEYRLHTLEGKPSTWVIGDHYEARAIDENGNACTVVWSISYINDEFDEFNTIEDVNWDFPDEVITDDGTVYNPDFTVIDWKNSKS